MHAVLDWPWGRTLARVEVGEWVEVEEFLYEAIQDELEEMGIRRGSVLECVGTEPLSIFVALAERGPTRISRGYAWFVRVKQCSKREDARRGHRHEDRGRAQRPGDGDRRMRRRRSPLHRAREPISRPIPPLYGVGW